MMHTLLFLLPMSFFIAACSGSSGESAKEKEVSHIIVTNSQFQSANMELGTITKQTIPTEVVARGYLGVPPSSEASVSPFYGGYVQKINVLPGAHVSKGDVLVLLQNPAYITLQQEYLEAKERLVFLKDDYDRQKQLAEENISSQKRFLKAQADYKATLATQEGLREQLRLMNVSLDELEAGQLQPTVPLRSPISGYVTGILTNIGAFVHPSETAIELINTEHIHLDLEVFEKDIPHVQIGQRIKYTIPEFREGHFEGVVFLVGKSISEKDRTVPVHGHLEEEDEGRFTPGMFVEATIEIARDSTLCLPREAVVAVDDAFFVAALLDRDSARAFFTPVEIKVGNKGDKWYEILDGQKLEGRELLTRGAFSIL